MRVAVGPLIQLLTWKDFELLADLIFARSGWQRLSVLGKTEKSVDLELMLPVTGDRAFVQVKSSAGLADLEEYIDKYRSMEQFREMFFVVHTPDNATGAQLREHARCDGVKLLGLDEITSLVVDSGLTQWLIQKTS